MRLLLCELGFADVLVPGLRLCGDEIPHQRHATRISPLHMGHGESVV
jgi:hypothetical protein